MDDVRIFGPEDVPRRVRDQAEALWAWYDRAGSDPERADEDLRRIEGGLDPEPGKEIWRSAVRVCREAGLDATLLASRLEASARLAEGLSISDGQDLRDFAEAWCGAHARLMAGLLGLTGSWQQDMGADLARGMFLVETVVHAREHAGRQYLFFPTEDRDRFGRAPGQSDGRPGAQVLWKQAVRARDALASGRPLIDMLPAFTAFRARRAWFSALELLLQAENQGWDVWTRLPRMDPAMRFRVVLQAVAGRTAFRRR